MKNNINTILTNASHSAVEFKKTYLLLEPKLRGSIGALVAYPGGKLKMTKDLNEVFSELSKEKSYTSYIDGFFGMGGSFKALSKSLKEHGVREVIANDFNRCIITMHFCVRNNADAMIDYFLETVRTKIIVPHKKLFIPAKEMLIVKNALVKRFEELQSKKVFGIETSALFIMLCAFAFSGTLDIKNNGDIKFTSKLYASNDITDFFFNTIGRISIFSELYNQFEMKFYNADYFLLHEKFHHQNNTLWNIDTVYLKEDYSEYIEANMREIKNSDIIGCTCDYGQKRFDHIGVLEGLKDIDFIYNNNTHPLIHHYINKYDLNHRKFIRSEAISNVIIEAKKITEIILYKNNFKEKHSPANVQTYKHNAITSDNAKTILKIGCHFSGIGAVDEAIRQMREELSFTNVEFKVIYAIEWDERVRQVYMDNWNLDPRHFYTNISKVDEKQLPDVDLIFTSPPCQSFSSQGKRGGFEDTRGTLIFDSLRIIDHQKPAYVLYENVKGVKTHDKGQTFKIIKNSFQDIGYTDNWKVLNSLDFDLPQNRERLFGLLTKVDIQALEFPTGTRTQKSLNDILEKNVDVSYNVESKYVIPNPKYNPNSKGVLAVTQTHIFTNSKYISDTKVQCSSGFIGTLTTGSSNTKIHIKETNVSRLLTERERMRLQGFSDSFKLPIKKDRTLFKTLCLKVSGNTIPVTLVKGLLQQVLASVENNSLLVSEAA